MMMSRSKSLEHNHAQRNENENGGEDEQDEDWMIEFGYCGDQALKKNNNNMNEVELSDQDDDELLNDDGGDSDYVGSEYKNNTNYNKKPTTTISPSIVNNNNNNNKENNNNNGKQQQSVSFFYKQDHTWSQLKIKKIVLTGDGFKLTIKRDQSSGNNKNFIASEWADGKKFSVIVQQPQRGWTRDQSKKLFADKKLAFQAACALHRELPAAREALREHAKQTVQMFNASCTVQN